MKNRTLVLALAIAASLPCSLQAQRLNDARVAFAPDASDARVARNGLVRHRALAGSVGLVVGASVGGLVGATFVTGNGEDVPVGIFLGGLIGGLVGTSLLVTISAESLCARSEQFVRAMAGSAVGAVGGGLLAAALQQVPVFAVGAAILGPPLGAAIAQGRC